MLPLTLAEIAAATGGRVDPPEAADVRVTAPASLDSRDVPEGGLFVALAGERVDGHDFAAAAVTGGAAAVLGAREVGVPAVVVPDPAVALGRLARFVLDRLRAEGELTVLAMTGSQGKTGVKDYLSQVLAAAGPTVATSGNFNNELGVPLTVLRADAATRYLVVEMGARGIGHIAYLCSIAPPDVAAVLNVGTAHLGEFGSVDAIARGKGEIVEALSADGVAVLNADDARVAAMVGRTPARVLHFGEGAGPDGVAWRGLTLDELGRPEVEVGHDGTWLPLQLTASGAHQVANAAAAAALAIGAGVDLEVVVAGLAASSLRSRWRMEVTERHDGLLVVNDAYNANPGSMAAALRTLVSIADRRSVGRSIAVLGEMLELGETSHDEHVALGHTAGELGVDVVVAVGAADGVGGWIADAARAAGAEAHLTPTRHEALAWLRHNVSARDVVLLKASRGGGLEVVAEGLLATGGDRAEGAGDPDQQEGPTT